MASEPNVGENGAGLPIYLRCEPRYSTIICTEHRTAYSYMNIATHLVLSHKAPKSLRDQVQRWCNEQNIAREVTEPPHHSPPISGLQVYEGWKCDVDPCERVTLSQSSVVIDKHCSKVHGLNSKRRREEAGAVSKVSMQKWFAKSNKYWIIDPRSATHSVYPTTPIRPSFPASSPFSTSRPQTLRLTSRASQSSNWLSQKFIELKDEEAGVRRTLGEAEHTAELTPWMRKSKYHEHFLNIDPESIPGAYLVPRKLDDHPQLFSICESLGRVLRKAYHKIPLLHDVDAKRLNSFQVGTVSQDPFNCVQEEQSLVRYITTSKRMICYFYRVLDEDYFDQHMFETTVQQVDAFHELCQNVHALGSYITSQVSDDAAAEVEEDAPGEDPELERLRKTVDEATLRLYVALIEHRTAEAAYRFQSAIMSYCAASSWLPGKTWMDENQSSSLFSQIIYCCQLVTLAESHRRSDCGEVEDPADALQQLCSQWMHNDSKGPIGDLLRLRLYTMAVGRDVVHPAQIRWRADGETLMYRDLTYRISDLATEIDFCLEQARLIFHRDLCLGIDDIPTFNLNDFEDNWDERGVGKSFLTDPRNAGILEPNETWLLDRIAESPELYNLVVQHGDDDTIGDRIRPAFAREHDRACQLFSGYLSILLHKGSGQASRVKEFLSLLYQNKLGSIRNLFCHDGYLLFVLNYHKSLHRTHASRYPVRFLLPEAAQLLVQYLVLILPLRRLSSKQVGIPSKTSEYLFHNGDHIQTGEQFMRFGRTVSQQAHGTPVNMSSWRQIAVGIAVKKFGGLDYQADLDLAGDDDDDLAGRSILDSWGGAMADVFHLQASHSVRTGNQVYGGTVNFERGLTDAGLQEYFKASRLWHQLCRPQRLRQEAGRRRRASTRPSQSISMPLRQKLAYRERPSRHRLRWGTEQVHFAMRQLFPASESPQFRSTSQQQLIEAIVTGCPEVVGVLATGQGKSLAFLLPSCLPRAAMTIVVVPLVALKADMVRRCREAELGFAVWDHSQDSQQYIGTPLLFVSIEQAVRRRFRTFLGQVDATEGLDRVVFDEAHLILTASAYRPKMSLVHQLRQLSCQVVYLTATLPPLMQAQFELRLLLKQPRVIRSCSFRSDIVYRVRPSSDPNLSAYVAKTIRSMLVHHESDPQARLIVYTRTRQEADDLSGWLLCPKYYSDSGDAQEKQEAMEQWRAGRSKVMVATSAFGMGIDFPSVRQVVHMGAPTDMIGFAQEVGRLSRDGQGGFSRIILPHAWRPSGLPSLVDQRRSAVSGMAMTVYLGENRCLNAVVSRFLDGVENMQYCGAENGRMRCSKCEQFGLFDCSREQDHTIWWDGESGSGRVGESEEDEEEDRSSMWASEVEMEKESATEPGGGGDCGGSQRLRDSMRDVATKRSRYEERLQTLQGRCMICMMLGQGHISPSAQWHELQQCRHIDRRAFIRAKQTAIQRNERQGGWMKKYVACFRCGQPQDICVVDGSDGRRECRYRDMIFPAAWALFHRSNRWGRTLGQLTGVASKTWSTEEKWMDWLGTECEMYGMRACQAARMMDVILSFELGTEASVNDKVASQIE